MLTDEPTTSTLVIRRNSRNCAGYPCDAGSARDVAGLLDLRKANGDDALLPLDALTVVYSGV